MLGISLPTRIILKSERWAGVKYWFRTPGARPDCFVVSGCGLISMSLPGKIRPLRRLINSRPAQVNRGLPRPLLRPPPPPQPFKEPFAFTEHCLLFTFPVGRNLRHSVKSRLMFCKGQAALVYLPGFPDLTLGLSSPFSLPRTPSETRSRFRLRKPGVGQRPLSGTRSLPACGDALPHPISVGKGG